MKFLTLCAVLTLFSALSWAEDQPIHLKCIDQKGVNIIQLDIGNEAWWTWSEQRQDWGLECKGETSDKSQNGLLISSCRFSNGEFVRHQPLGDGQWFDEVINRANGKLTGTNYWRHGAKSNVDTIGQCEKTDPPKPAATKF